MAFLLSVFSISYLTPDFHPDGELKLILNKTEISQLSERLIKKIKPGPDNKMRVNIL